MAPVPPIWVLTDGRAGNEKQALALAHALSANEPHVWRLESRAPWKMTAPRKLPGSEYAFGEAFRLALRKPPQIAIGCGRQAALATRLLREAGARVVQILDPRIDPRHWDVVIVPEHDRVRGPNVVTMVGSLHEVDAGWLADARGRFPEFGALPSPRTVLLLGGPIANAPLDDTWWRSTVETLRVLHRRDGGSVSICTSRRTPSWMIEAVRRDLSGLRGVRWLGPEDGANPYTGLLAWADLIIVSPDSVNMITEACATTAVVVVAAPTRATGRHARFLQSLIECGRVQALDLSEQAGPATPIVETKRIAAMVRARVETLNGGFLLPPGEGAEGG
jgi:mitochondrial fission protein ELM1